MESISVNPLYPKAKARLEAQMSRIRGSRSLTPKNKDDIASFLVRCQGNGISVMRLIFYANRLRQVGEILKKDFKDAQRADFERVMAELEARGYKGHTVDAFIVSIKCFYKWLFGLDKNEPLPKCVSWIDRRRPPNTLKKEDLLTEEDVNLLIRSTDDRMLKTMIAVLYESAVRPEELRGLRMRDVFINATTVKLYVHGKMVKEQGERVVFLARSYPILKDWVQMHGNAKNPDGWLWPSKTEPGLPVSDAAFRQAIYRLGKAILPHKRLWPYLFRHSTGTWIYKTFPSPIARRMMGHVAGSRMERVYVHLAEEDIEMAVEEHYNLEGSEKPVKKGTCVKCGSIIYLGDGCCRKCGLAENSRAAYERDQEEQITNATMNILMEDSLIQKRIMELRDDIRERLHMNQ